MISNTTTVQIIAASSVPSWATGLTQYAWTGVSPTVSFASIKEANIGQGNASNIMQWGGAGLATGLGDSGSFIHWNGGHLNYYGNEVYRFDLATLAWSKLNVTSPSPFSSTNWVNGLRNDGRPAVPHTYHFVGVRNNVFYTTRRETTNAGGGGVYMVATFDLTAGGADPGWTVYNTQPSFTVEYGQASTCYDTSRDCVWLIQPGAYAVAKWDFATNAWSSYTAGAGNFPTRSACAYIPTKDFVMFVVSGQGSVEYGMDPASPNSNPVSLITSGTPPSDLGGGGCLQWSSNLNAAIWYPNFSSQIWKLAAPPGDWRTDTWVWSQVSTTGTVTVDPSISGGGDGSTYSKFQICEWGSTTVAVINWAISVPLQVVRLA